MADGVIKVSVSANKKNSVTVSSNKNNTEITATADAGRFWAQTAKNWAVSDVLVDNTDYSAKYYAQQSSMSENNAKNHAETTQQIYNQFLDVVDTSTNNFLNTKEEALEDLENAKTETLMAIQAKSNEGVESIENEANNSLEELISLKSSTLNEVNNTKIEATSSITTLSNDYISQINTTGKSYNTLTNKQITNCILEIPQRIKYTLENGTLTIKAGSVVIVPYGVEDLTSQYPKGATFINDNFKVYDTQFEDGKFFVWAEVVNDISISQAGTVTGTNAIILINLDNIALTYSNTEYALSGNDYSTANAYKYYETTTNTMYHRYVSTEALYKVTNSFPIILFSREQGVITSIDQVFNGMGYIGSTFWVDKGVKGLIPNGRNEDGTLRNDEFITPNLLIKTLEWSSTNINGMVFLQEDGVLHFRDIKTTIINNLQPISTSTGSADWYNPSNNEWKRTTDNAVTWENVLEYPIATFSIGSIAKQITGINSKQPFRAVDFSDKSEVSGWGMPSARKHLNLTVGASGTRYVAPVSGWVLAWGYKNTSQAGYIQIFGSGTASGVYTPQGWGCPSVYIPIKKGVEFRVEGYNNTSDAHLQILYSEGEA